MVSVDIEKDWNHLYIDGERRTPDRETIEVENPATREVIAEVPAGTAGDVDDAFAAAVEAQREWRNRPPQERAEVIQSVLHELHECEDEFAELLVREAGSTQLKAHVELEVLASGMLAETASFPTRSQGTKPESVIPGKENEVRREPAGVVGIISPWNVPFHLSMRAVAPAIALGNAVVLKPAEETSISGGLAIAELFEAAGLPEGLLNVVPGWGHEAGDALASHPDVDVVSFTGSTAVGREVAKNAVDNLALPALELGGNNAHVVLEDADLDRAVDAGVFGSFMHQGQICISINRHLVHESLYDEYVERMVERAAALEVGNPVDPEVDIGPVIKEEQRDKMLEFVRESANSGATVEIGGTADGLFVEPTVLSGVSNEMPAACNEHFGPIVPVIPFESTEEAIELANDTEMGLSGSVHGELEHARSVAERIETGMIHVNDQPINDEPHVPFGGDKASGIGRYNGEEIIREFTKQKWISVQHDEREYPL
ncbi:aldehyde dehydrogenase family protein [Natrarchaeobius oligotrophus]|uniref:Aldehyde dehydrogenase family protein n=1 Tax=Natrarchaeobius chitinivorans TaxID=1679083 RepID=A0A3N6MM53_NATCH|nr:aldehyde dehydrogenase family protein [Natrarchaeobius chitinivorans]RQH02615.1 aldehyde dehydrogenase family protein [Natrarchaeobius chitinivorans]